MNKRELYDVLENLERNHQSVSADQNILRLCQEIFEQLDLNFDLNDPGKILDKLIDFEAADIKNNPKKLTEVIESLAANTEKNNLPESKSLNAQELKELLRQLDEHEEKIGKEAATNQSLEKQIEALRGVDPWLAKIKEEHLKKIIEKRRAIEKEEINKGKNPAEAEELAEETIKVEQEIKEITPNIDEEKRRQLTKEIVEGKDIIEGVKELTELKEQVAAEKIIHEEIREIANDAVDEIKNKVTDLSEEEEREIFELIRKKTEETAADPLKKISDPEIKKTNNGIDVGKTVEEKIAGIILKKPRDIETENYETREKAVNSAIKMAVDKTEISIEKLYETEGVRLSKINLRAKRGELFAKDIDPEEIKAILNLRYAEDDVGESFKTVKILEQENCPDGKHEAAVGRTKVLGQLLKSHDEVEKNIGKIAKVSKKLKGIKGMEPLVEMAEKIGGNKKIMRGMEMVRKVVQFREKIDGLTGNSLTQVGRILKIKGLENFGQGLLTRFGGEMGGAIATHFAEFGFENGIRSILGQLFKTGTIKAVEAGAGAAAEAAAAAAGETVLGAAAISTGPPGWVIGLIIFAADQIRKMVGGLFKKAGGKLVEMLDGAGLISKSFLDKTGAAIKNIGGGLVVGLGVLGTTILAIPTMLAGAFSLVGPVMAITIVALIGYNMYQTASTQISPLVINKDTSAGICIPVEEINKTGPGTANCDINAPATNAINVTKANFVNVAERWKTGGGKNAEKCFNDVVCKAKSVGINPDYALWAWLHESGASNYSGFPGGVSDFGIVFAPKNDFNSQIGSFLKLDPASGCMGKNGINDYWLAFAANYLNGSGNCDPDFLNPSSNITPRQYLAELQSTWGWVSSGPMPNSIKITPEKCGGGTDNSTIIDGPNGAKMVCEQGPGEAVSSSFNPNAPGLTGEVIPGECSVSEKVVLTKQCDLQWASKPLPRGGTICQAGCGPTSVSMLLRRINGSWTPDSVIYAPGSAYSDMGGGGSSFDQAYLTLVKQFGGGAVTLDGTTRSCDEKAIGKWICAGKVVMVLEDAYTKSGVGGHFVLGVAVQNGNIITADPYYDTKTPFDGKKEYGHAATIRGCLTIDAAAIK